MGWLVQDGVGGLFQFEDYMFHPLRLECGSVWMGLSSRLPWSSSPNYGKI